MAEASQQRLEVTQKETRAAPQHCAFPLLPGLPLLTALQPCGSAQARWAKMAELSWRTRRFSATFQPTHAGQVLLFLSLRNVTG